MGNRKWIFKFVCFSLCIFAELLAKVAKDRFGALQTEYQKVTCRVLCSSLHSFYWPVCWFPDDWTRQFLFVVAIWCEWKRKCVNSLQQPSWGRLLRDTAERTEMFLARGATCESTVFFFCDSRRRFLRLDVSPPPPRVGRACRSSILPFLFTLCVRVLWLLLVRWRRIASSLCLFSLLFFSFVYLLHACTLHLIWSSLSGLLQPENIVLTLQVKLCCTLDLRRHSLPCSHRV